MNKVAKYFLITLIVALLWGFTVGYTITPLFDVGSVWPLVIAILGGVTLGVALSNYLIKRLDMFGGRK